jgi:uncharacterized protein involved in exopolysaccharide biosynthesis
MADHFIQDVKRKKWSILIFTLGASLFALILSLLMPAEYLSGASLLPSNSKLMDKQRLFGNNIQELYSAYGNAEDLDRLFATMHSSAVINDVADSLKLVSHYELDGRKNARSLARKKLEKNIKLQRSEYGELRLRVWDKDPATAEMIASALISKTQQVFDEMFKLYYDRSINNLNQELRAREKLVQLDSSLVMRAENVVIKSKISEYQVTKLNPPAAFFVMEKPAVSTIPDRPVIWLNVLATFLVSLFTMLAWIAASRNGEA